MLQLDNINDFEWRRLVERLDKGVAGFPPDVAYNRPDGIMSEPLSKLADRFTPSGRIAAAVIFIASVLVIAIGFDFDVVETLEVLVTGVLLVGVMGIAAGIAGAVGYLVDRLTGDASR